MGPDYASAHRRDRPHARHYSELRHCARKLSLRGGSGRNQTGSRITVNQEGREVQLCCRPPLGNGTRWPAAAAADQLVLHAAVRFPQRGAADGDHPRETCRWKIARRHPAVGRRRRVTVSITRAVRSTSARPTNRSLEEGFATNGGVCRGSRDGAGINVRFQISPTPATIPTASPTNRGIGAGAPERIRPNALNCPKPPDVDRPARRRSAQRYRHGCLYPRCARSPQPWPRCSVAFRLSPSRRTVSSGSQRPPSVQSLNGAWQFKYIAGSIPRPSAPMPRSRRPRFSASDAWKPIKCCPVCWELQGFAEPKYGKDLAAGTGLYRRTFRVPDTWKDQRIYLRFRGGVLYGFDGVGQRRGRRGRGPADIIPARFDITDALKRRRGQPAGGTSHHTG